MSGCADAASSPVASQEVRRGATDVGRHGAIFLQCGTARAAAAAGGCTVLRFAGRSLQVLGARGQLDRRNVHDQPSGHQPSGCAAAALLADTSVAIQESRAEATHLGHLAAELLKSGSGCAA